MEALRPPGQRPGKRKAQRRRARRAAGEGREQAGDIAEAVEEAESAVLLGREVGAQVRAEGQRGERAVSAERGRAPTRNKKE